MKQLELMKIKSELARVESGKAEQEYQIALRKDEIERLEKSIETSDIRINELKQQINSLT
jgi:predicted  nucleic acid-binding Zn-ribbon protein